MNKKYLLILIALTLFTFANSLFNGFLGDDHVVIENNNFYKSSDNLLRLFDKSYLTDGNSLYNHSNQYDHSGSVAYRPVRSLTYVCDYWLWGLNPFGYHLTNLMLHVVNAGLVYFLVFCFLKSNIIAFFSSLLFSLHPVKTEAVCSIGYRADLVACLLSLTAFLFFVRACNVKRNKAGSTPCFVSYLFSLICFFLALFAKESAIVLLGLFVFYDLCFNNLNFKDLAVKSVHRYFSFLAVVLFYLFVYWKVFPNTSLVSVGFMGGDWFSHVLSMFWILGSYVLDLFFPFVVKPLPPLYAPMIEPWMVFKIVFSCLILLLSVGGIFKFYSKGKRAKSFFLFWFLFSLLPVMNIVPIANPMAHRFLYFPSVGFVVFVALFFERLVKGLEEKKDFKNVGKIIKPAVVALCLVCTIPLNMAWKDDFSMGLSLVENHPENEKGYSILGLALFKAGRWTQAREYLIKSADLGSGDPMIYYLLGMVFFDDDKQAEKYFHKSIEMSPAYNSPYLGLGRMFCLNKEYEKAMPYLEKSLEIMPTYSGSGYLIQSYMKMGREDDAKILLEKVSGFLNNKRRVESLRRLIDEADRLVEPVDIGI